MRLVRKAAPETVQRAGRHVFDLNYYRGVHWYRGHFPIAEIAHWVQRAR